MVGRSQLAGTAADQPCPALASRLRQLDGTQVLHGWNRSRGARWMNLVMYGHDNRSEFREIDPVEAAARLDAALQMIRGINGITPQWFGAPRWQQTRTLAVLLRARGFAAWMGRQGVVLATGRHLPIPALNFDGGERALPQAVGHLRRRGAIRQFRFIDSLAASGLPPHDPDRFRAPPRTGVLLLPGSRGGATLNALFLLECLPTDAANYLGLMPCTEAVDFATIRRTLTGGRLGRVAGAGGIARADGTRMRRGRPRDSGP